MEKVEKLSDLVNIGQELESQLNEVGIYTRDDLERYGAKEAWLKIQQIDSSACIHRLQALEAALQGIKKSQLSDGDKQNLRDFYREHKLYPYKVTISSIMKPSLYEIGYLLLCPHVYQNHLKRIQNIRNISIDKYIV